MATLAETLLPMAGERPCAVRCVRARRGDTSLADLVVDIDLQTFVESSISRTMAVALLHKGEVFLLLAEEEIVGVALCMRSWDTPDEAMLLSMGIRPGWRGRGLGQRFVGWVLEALESDGLTALSLVVGSENVRALRLYRELGFDVLHEGDVEPLTGERQLLLRVRLSSA